jgi:GNAT superfamily N-acetyltransferase
VRTVVIRAAGPGDGRALTDALVEAANWDSERSRPRVTVLADPMRRRYIAAWRRPGDAGFLAEDDTGDVLGAAWYRLFSGDRPGLGFVATGVPELVLGVKPIWRAQGIGRILLRELLVQAAADGHARISLSVERGNFAHRLYTSEHFAVVESRGSADIMVRTLH